MLTHDLLGGGLGAALEHHLLAVEYAGVSLQTVWWALPVYQTFGALLIGVGGFAAVTSGATPLIGLWEAHLHSTWGGVAGVSVYVTAVTAMPRAWLVWLPESVDLGLLGVEVAVVALCLRRAVTSGLVRVLSRVTGYDSVALFCQTRGVALTEVAVVTTLMLGVIIFDAVVVLAEDDALEALCYLLGWLVLLSFIFIWVGVDVQYVYMVCAVGGQPSWRLLYTDVVNNSLAIFRVVFCWVRYLFYDLQTEALDFATHATAMGAASVWDIQTEVVVPGTPAYWISLLTWLGFVLLDCGWWLVQLVLGVVKMALAVALFGVIMDLFILRAAAWTELRQQGGRN